MENSPRSKWVPNHGKPIPFFLPRCTMTLPIQKNYDGSLVMCRGKGLYTRAMGETFSLHFSDHLTSFIAYLFFCRRKGYSDDLSKKTNVLLFKESQWTNQNCIPHFTTDFNVDMANIIPGFCWSSRSSYCHILFYVQSKPQVSLGFLGRKGTKVSVLSGFYVEPSVKHYSP